MTLGKHSYFLGKDGGQAVAGNFTSIATGVYIHGPDDRACIINHDLLSTFDFGNWGVKFTRSGYGSTNIIGSDVWIGEHVQIMNGVRIHDGAIVGAHSVVGKDVPPYAVVVGNPIEIKRFRFDPDIIHELLKVKWWDWPDELIKERLNDFNNVYNFLKKYQV